MKIKFLSLVLIMLASTGLAPEQAQAREYGYVAAPSYGYVQAPSYGYVQAPSYGYVRTGCRPGTTNGWIDWSNVHSGGQSRGGSSMFWRMNSMYRNLGGRNYYGF